MSYFELIEWAKVLSVLFSPLWILPGDTLGLKTFEAITTSTNIMTVCYNCFLGDWCGGISNLSGYHGWMKEERWMCQNAFTQWQINAVLIRSNELWLDSPPPPPPRKYAACPKQSNSYRFVLVFHKSVKSISECMKPIWREVSKIKKPTNIQRKEWKLEV